MDYYYYRGNIYFTFSDYLKGVIKEIYRKYKISISIIGFILTLVVTVFVTYNITTFVLNSDILNVKKKEKIIEDTYINDKDFPNELEDSTKISDDELEVNSSFIEVTIDKALSVSDFDFNKTGIINATVLNVRSDASKESDITGEIWYNTKVNYSDFDNDWAVIDYNGEVCFINKNYISDSELSNNYKEVEGDKRKSFLDYHKITDKTSRQYKLQAYYAVTEEKTGLRIINGRYCIAVGSYFSKSVGQYVDVILENGEIIPCIIAECKDDKNTNANNSVGDDGSVTEFVVDESHLSKNIKQSGDICDIKPEWDSKVIGIKLYNKTLL